MLSCVILDQSSCDVQNHHKFGTWTSKTWRENQMKFIFLRVSHTCISCRLSTFSYKQDQFTTHYSCDKQTPPSATTISSHPRRNTKHKLDRLIPRIIFWRARPSFSKMRAALLIHCRASDGNACGRSADRWRRSSWYNFGKKLRHSHFWTFNLETLITFTLHQWCKFETWHGIIDISELIN